jgi:hypothetical protein
MNTSPCESTAMFCGDSSPAEVAGPLLPDSTPEPFPAIVVMSPLDALTSRIRLLPWSAMNKSPAESTAMPGGVFSSADLAAPPSPENPPSPYFDPATV